MKNIHDLTGRVALVTGASRGIGASTAHHLAANGAIVAVNSRKSEGVAALVAEIEAAGGKAFGVVGNVGTPEECRAIFEKTLELSGGRLDILVNNAASNPVFGGVEMTDDRAFQKIMDVNLKAPFELSKLSLPIMARNGGGSIINISSIGGIKPEQGLGIYSVSKAALISLTQVMAKEWGSRGVRVNAICPGLIQTKFSESLWEDEKTLGYFERKIPLRRMGQPDEIGALALFLASDAGSYCTGSCFTADGGFLII